MRPSRLSALRNVTKRTKVCAEWKSGTEVTYSDHLLILENFKLFALLYLNDWCEKDRDFVVKVSSTTNTTKARLRDLQDAVVMVALLWPWARRRIERFSKSTRFRCALHSPAVSMAIVYASGPLILNVNRRGRRLVPPPKRRWRRIIGRRAIQT